MSKLRIGPDYSAFHELSDGTEVHLGLIGPKDRDKLAAGFERLSPESRYRRFLVATPKLTDETLRYLTDTDGWNHLAIGAETVTADPAAARGLGVARFLRLKDAPDTAEAAVAVIDEMQGRGLGRLLLSQLVLAARERELRKFRAYFLPSNEPAKDLVREMDPNADARFEDDFLVYEMALSEIPDPVVAGGPLYRLFKLAAGGLEVVLRRVAKR